MADNEQLAKEETAGLISADKVEGTAVYDLGGEKVGTVENVMIGKLSGKVRYVVLASGGFLGIGEDRLPLPWDVLTYDEGKNGYVVASERAKLDTAPTIKPGQDIDWNDRQWGERVHRHFEASPYWMM